MAMKLSNTIAHILLSALLIHLVSQLTLIKPLIPVVQTAIAAVFALIILRGKNEN